MGSNVKTINDLKAQVHNLIQENVNREIIPTTKYNKSGVYMIYIDNFTDEQIVPIYVGQAKNIQKRYKQHFSELLSLNRLSYHEYKEYFFSKKRSYYEGSFKAFRLLYLKPYFYYVAKQ